MNEDELRQDILCKFDSYIKTVVKNTIKSYQRETIRRNRKYTVLSDIQDDYINKFIASNNRQPINIFNVLGLEVYISDDDLADALKELSSRNRNGLLMYYFFEMSDSEIAKIQNITRSGVYQNRKNSIKLIRDLIGENYEI